MLDLESRIASLLLGAAAGLAASSLALAAPSQDDAAFVFAEAQAICDRDGGAFWGRSLCGPMLLVDPQDRGVVANVADAGGSLKLSGTVYVGTLPESVIVADTPTEWSGTRWTQLIMPLTFDAAKRHVTIAHELFHRIQPALKLTRAETANGHLDTLDGRYLMQLEWRALAAALAATSARARNSASADALLFRALRYRRFDGAAASEAALEVNEGIAEYTGVMLGLDKPGDRVAYTIANLWSWTLVPSQVRSFAYATGPAYGLLLDRAGPAWRGPFAAGQRLDQLLAAALKLAPATPGRFAARARVYDDGSLQAAEQERDARGRAELAAFKALLVDGPVLVLPLRNGNFRFNPQTLRRLDGAGTIYPTMRLDDDWGSLEVESRGALVAANVATVTAASIDIPGLRGDGWRLRLNPGWLVRRADRPGDWIVAPGQPGR